MLSEAYHRVATLQLGSNCCSFIAIFAALSSATQKCERALNVPYKFVRAKLSNKVTNNISQKLGSHL